MRNILLFVSLSLLTSCAHTATTEAYEKVLESWVGSSEEKLVLSWGPPTKTYSYGSNKKVITYDRSMMVTSGSAAAMPYTGTIIGKSTSWAEGCVTDIFIDQSGIIEKWKHNGENCKAAAEQPTPLLKGIGL